MYIYSLLIMYDHISDQSVCAPSLADSSKDKKSKRASHLGGRKSQRWMSKSASPGLRNRDLIDIYSASYLKSWM